VRYIGLDRRESLRDTTVLKTSKKVSRARKMILEKFPDMVSCSGTRIEDGGRQVIPNWKMKPGKKRN